LNSAIDQVLQNPLPDAPKPLAFSILRIPFFLEPDYDENKVYVETNRERLVKKWGGKAGWEDQKHRHDLKGRGLEAGIPFFNLDRKTSSTMASHRLIQYLGKTYGLAVSEAVYDKLNVYYFVEGHSLNDRPRLAGVVCDLLQELLPNNAPSEADLLEFLDGDEGKEEISHAIHALDQLGIHGIPKFIIEGRTMVDGAARSDTFVHIFREIEKRGSVYSGPIFNDVLGVSDETMQRPSHALSK
jgi:predicted DsbA family dithiol-disulfide isomerase